MFRTDLRRATVAWFLLLALAPGPTVATAADVVIITSAEVDAYRDAIQGFKEVVQQRVVAEYDMAGDFARGRRILAEIETKVRPDLVFAVGVWALQLVTGRKSEVPVVYAMVLNPPAVLGADARHVTGASMNVPVDEQLRLLRQLGRQVQRVGVVYRRDNTGYLVRRAAAVAREEGLTLVTREVQSAREAIPALDALQEDGIDAFWLLPDEVVLAPPVVEHMLLVSYRKRIPLLGLHESQARMGALVTLSFASSQDIGRQAGELAKQVLSGTAPAALPYTTARQLRLAVNLKTAQKLGLELPGNILARADVVIE